MYGQRTLCVSHAPEPRTAWLVVSGRPDNAASASPGEIAPSCWQRFLNALRIALCTLHT